MGYEVDIYNEFNSNLRAIWKVFENECDHYVFQCYDWLEHWHKTIGTNLKHIQPCIAIVNENEMPVALFPLGIRKCLGARVLEFLGGDQSDYNSPLIAPVYSKSHQLNKIWKSVKHQLPVHDIQLFNKLPARLNQSENSIFHFWHCKPIYDAFSATLPESWELYEQRISKKIRNDSKRQLRRLAEHGEVQFLIANTDGEYNRFVTAMLEQKKQRFQETGARDVLSDSAAQAFYRDLRGAVGDKGSVHLSVLMLENNILATHWGVVYGDRFYFLIPTFSQDIWSKYSTGRLLQERIIEWSIDNGLKIFDFTIGGEHYKKAWCDKKMTIYSKEKLVSIYGVIFLFYNATMKYLRMNHITRKYLMKLNSKLARFRK